MRYHLLGWASASSPSRRTSASRPTSVGGSTRSGRFTPNERTDYGFGDGGERRLLRWHQLPRGATSSSASARSTSSSSFTRRTRPRAARPPTCCRSARSTTRSCAWWLNRLPIFGLYSGARFVVVGTPAGITLAPEGRLHQSTDHSVDRCRAPGADVPRTGVRRALDWLLCDGLAELAAPEGRSTYLRLSTRPIDQTTVRRRRRATGRGRRARRRAGRCHRLWEPDGPATSSSPPAVR